MLLVWLSERENRPQPRFWCVLLVVACSNLLLFLNVEISLKLTFDLAHRTLVTDIYSVSSCIVNCGQLQHAIDLDTVLPDLIQKIKEKARRKARPAAGGSPGSEADSTDDIGAVQHSKHKGKSMFSLGLLTPSLSVLCSFLSPAAYICLRHKFPF